MGIDGRVRPMTAGCRPGRGPRLRHQEILAAAIGLVDAEGLGHLTMVSEVETDPGLQLLADDDWRDYLDRLAHGIRSAALAHPRAFPLAGSAGLDDFPELSALAGLLSRNTAAEDVDRDLGRLLDQPATRRRP